MPGEQQHLDMSVLGELKNVMGDEFSLLVETFVSDSRTRIESIGAAVSSADPEAIRRAAHSFKGSASNMGAPLLTDLCRRLEDLGRDGHHAGAVDLYEQIRVEYDAVQAQLDAI